MLLILLWKVVSCHSLNVEHNSYYAYYPQTAFLNVTGNSSSFHFWSYLVSLIMKYKLNIYVLSSCFSLAHLVWRKQSNECYCSGKPVCESLTESQQSQFAFTREETVSEMNLEIWGWSSVSFATQGAVRGQGNSRELGSHSFSAEWICFLC